LEAIATLSFAFLFRPVAFVAARRRVNDEGPFLV